MKPYRGRVYVIVTSFKEVRAIVQLDNSGAFHYMVRPLKIELHVIVKQ